MLGDFRFDRLGSRFAGEVSHRSRPWRGTAQRAVPGMVEATAGGLDVGPPSLEIGASLVVNHRIEAGKTGPGGEEDRQEEDSLDLKNPWWGQTAGHGTEYSYGRISCTIGLVSSLRATVRRRGPSAGSRNQKAAPLP